MMVLSQWPPSRVTRPNNEDSEPLSSNVKALARSNCGIVKYIAANYRCNKQS